MKMMLYKEISLEKCNAQALGAYNKAVELGLINSGQKEESGKTWVTEGVEVYTSYNEAGKDLISELNSLGANAKITFVSKTGSTYGEVNYGGIKEKFRISGHDVLSMDKSKIDNTVSKVDHELRPQTWMGFTPKGIKDEARSIYENIKWLSE